MYNHTIVFLTNTIHLCNYLLSQLLVILELTRAKVELDLKIGRCPQTITRQRYNPGERNENPPVMVSAEYVS